jgi:GNAT-family acetyltransferase (TIGR03103 family)
MPKAIDRPGSRERREALTLRSWGDAPVGPDAEALDRDAVLDCGWGRLLFGHTFLDPQRLADLIAEERPGTRDIAMYIRDPQVVLALDPQRLFLDPSHTFRLWLSDHRPAPDRPPGFLVRRLESEDDARAVNRIYAERGMVRTRPERFPFAHRTDPRITYFVAQDAGTGAVIGTVTGVDHVRTFNDPEGGTSLWCLAVDPQASHPGVGAALVTQLAEHYQARGRAFLDLSVLHDNTEAIALYTKLGFRRVPAFCVKRKNPINEELFVGPAGDPPLNPYAAIIVDEARRRGISVDVLDAERALFTLSFGGRTIRCRESLSDLTTGVAYTICDDKALTYRVLERAGLSVPAHREAGSDDDNRAFLAEWRRVVVKPAHGEQGRGVAADIRTAANLERAVARARRLDATVLLEQFVEGEDLRIIVIDGAVVAAAIRRPAAVTGTGRHSVRTLIKKQSRRRAAATGGESRIPLDAETQRVVGLAGFGLDEVLPAGQTIPVRRTANLHTGGTMHDVTDALHPTVRKAAERAAAALRIPVVGLDVIVPSADGEEYVILEANERPGLANHEPQPTAQRFVDLLFPRSTALGGP